MKIHILKYTAIVLFFASCSSDFLEIPPKDNLNALSFYKTKDDFNSGITTIYAELQRQVTYYFELEYRSDNLNILAPTAGTQDRYDLNEYADTPANGILQNAWGSYYVTIFRSNIIIDNIRGKDFSEKNQIEAEAKFLRALTYFNVVRFWGEVPLVLNPIGAEAALTLKRSPITDVYEQIENDLIFAAGNLPSSQSNGRATSGAAKALLGKVYLTQKKYPEAVTTLNDVVGSYSLLNDVKDVFSTTNKNNNEIIFSIGFDKDISGENHSLWLGVSDVSTADISTKLIDAYDTADERRFLATYQPNGSLFAPGKFLDTESETTRMFGNDYILLRYADVLLMLAEAKNEIVYQATGDAFDDLNDVRERAGLTALTATEIPDQTSFREAVLNERFLELPYEGHRWFDLIRTETAKEEMAELGKTVQDHQLLFPIPQAEIEKVNNPDILGQNPGY